MVKLLKKILLSLCIIMILINFTIYSASFAADGDSLSPEQIAANAENDYKDNSIGSIIATGLSGIAGILITIPKLGSLAAASVIQTMGSGIANIGNVTGAEKVLMLTPDDILFDKISLTSIDFFNIEKFPNGATIPDGNIIKEIRLQIALWYYVMRTIAIVILLIILIFVGIRMAITTVASEKAIYKKALFDWATSLALVFLLHYLIRAILWMNSALVSIFKDITYSSELDGLLDALVKLAFNPDFCVGVGATLIYIIITIQTLMFLITYIKRVLVLAFLIIISPLITITYSVDKMGDQKAQALNTWLKEFSYNVLIQPFHCILYIVFVSIAIKTVNSVGSMGAMLLAILCIKFVWDGEKIVRKIFGFEQASSLAAAAASGAIIGSALSKATSAGKTAVSGIKYANNSKTGQLLKQKLGDKKVERKDLKGLTHQDKKDYKQAKKDKDSTKMNALKNKAKENREQKAKEREGKKIHQFAEKTKQNARNLKDNKVIKGVKSFANSELGQAIGTDVKRFARKLTQPENIAKVSAMMFAGAATFALPEQNLITAAAGGYTAGKAAENKVREIRNRKSENYEADVLKAWENHCNANPNTNKNDQDAFETWMKNNAYEGKMDMYSQKNLSDSQKDAKKKLSEQKERLGISDSDIDKIIAKIQQSILSGEGYDPAKTFSEIKADPNELNNIVGAFATLYNNSQIFNKTDAFDTQMEPMGYDHEDVMNGMDVTKLENNNPNPGVDQIVEKVTQNDLDTKTDDEIIRRLEEDVKTRLDQAINEVKNVVNTLDLSEVEKGINEITSKLETNMQQAMDSGVSDLTTVIQSTLSDLKVGYKAEQIDQVINNTNITKIVEEKQILQNNTQTVINEIHKMRDK